ncbi:MAG TPA: SDR family oxidoreductase [Saprospiraceae bacterium]|nr:SDR family oxidoreductase [Saprospiraceae bacterium]
MQQTIFITGGTGYIGKRLIPMLLKKNCRVVALVRRGSEGKVSAGCEVVTADPFEANSFAAAIPAGCTFVQLLGVPRPSPRKRDQFYAIDLKSVQASAVAAQQASARHFVYVSVSQTPTSIMRDYQQVRATGEAAIRATGIPHTFIRPWYVLGPGHWWPILLWPLYKVLEIMPATREKALDLGLVTLSQMLGALVSAVENPPAGERVWNVPDIRRGQWIKQEVRAATKQT